MKHDINSNFFFSLDITGFSILCFYSFVDLHVGVIETSEEYHDIVNALGYDEAYRLITEEIKLFLSFLSDFIINVEIDDACFEPYLSFQISDKKSLTFSD